MIAQCARAALPFPVSRPEAPPVFCTPYEGHKTILDDKYLEVTYNPERFTPRLNVVGPTYALWGGVNIAGPLYFFISTNYLSLIDRFELSIFRGGDVTVGSPIKTFVGKATDLMHPIAWSGELDTRGEIRPGETFTYVLRVYDKLRNMDQTIPRTFTVQRYLLPRQRETLATRRNKILTEFDSRDHTLHRAINTAGYPFKFRVKTKGKNPLYVGGALISSDMHDGFTQILLPGDYIFSLDQAERKQFAVQGKCEYRLRINARMGAQTVTGQELIQALQEAPEQHRRLSYVVDGKERYPIRWDGKDSYVIVEKTTSFAAWPKEHIVTGESEDEAPKSAIESILDYTTETFDLTKGARLFTLQSRDIREESLQVIAMGLEAPVILLRNIHYTYYAPRSWVSLTESGEEYIKEGFKQLEVSYKVN